MSMNSDSRTQSKSEPSWTPDEDCESTRDVRPRGSTSSPLITLTDSLQTLGVCDSNSMQEHRNEEAAERRIQPQDRSSSSDPAVHKDENEEMIISSIRATDVVLGLRRHPAGFYAAVHHCGIEWRTENKASSVDNDVIEWNGPIPIPSDPSATIRIEIYASFEFQPTFCVGEQLRRLTLTMEQLSDRSARDVPFTFFPKDGDVVSPCSSISVAVQRQKCKSNDSSPSSVLDSYCPSTESRGELAEATNRGHNALSRYRKHGEKRDLEVSLAEFVRALSVCPVYHPCRAAAQSNLATAKFILCQVEGTDALVPLGLYRDALRARPIGHADRPSTLIQLAAVHFARFEKFGDEVERGRAEVLLHEVMELSSARGHDNRAAAIMLRLGRSVGPVHSDDQSLVNQDLTSHLTGEDLISLSDRLLYRFERFGDLAALEVAITVMKELIRSTSVLDGSYRTGLGNLGLALLYRFKHLGELGDLENAISTLRDAVNLTPHGHPNKPALLNNPGSSFRARFERLGEMSDLKNAILILRGAVDLTPHGRPDKPHRISNLGASSFTRFGHLDELSDLESAILTFSDALHLTPHDHPDKPARLNNLATSFSARFEYLGELSDLENAISMLRDAVDLCPHGHTHKPAILENLGTSFSTRFEHLTELSDLENAISTLRHAVDLTPHGHPDKPRCLNNLGACFATRFGRLGKLSDLEHAISLYCHSASSPFGTIATRFRASQKWISLAHRTHHHPLLHAYSVATNLLPQLAWTGLSLGHRYSELTRGADVVRDAAAAALQSGFLETAVEWPERGRSIVWGELLQLRSSYEELSSAHPDQARRLRELSAALDHAGVTREKSLSALSEHPGSASESLEQEADRHRMFAIERDKLLREIRRLPGFEQFLLQKEFSRLRASVHAGTVVILNAAETSCDALIVLVNVDRVVHVPLSNFTFKRSVDLQKKLKSFVRHARDGKRETDDSVNWESFLSPLWKCVVKPVLQALAFSTPGNLSRIFWCPTGPFAFLPIHAAGFYDAEHSQPGHKVFDFVVSSYVPSLAILPSPVAMPTGDLRLLVVRQPPSDGLSRLPGVVTELKCIREVIGGSPSASTTVVESSVGTVEEVLSLMMESDWVHFACHGIQDPQNRTNSGLCLADGRRLKLSDIIALSRPQRGLAFLSACQTATGDDRLSDEAIHITARMLFAGYGGVVGTTWSISDRLAPVVARHVYEHLFRNGTRPDYREAAHALHEAIEHVRDCGIPLFDEWIPFIHVGL